MKPDKLLGRHEASFSILENKGTKLVLVKGQCRAETEILSFDGWPEEDKHHGKCWRKTKTCQDEAREASQRKVAPQAQS